MDQFTTEKLIPLKKPKVKKPKQVSPYTTFQNWLFNSFPDAKLDESVIKALSSRAVLGMLGNAGGITMFLNEHFNNYDVMKLQPIEFYKFIRHIIQKHKLSKYDFTFFKSEKRDKSLNELQMFLPHLKKYEISALLDLSSEDEEYESFMDNLGLKKYKKSRVKKLKEEKKSKGSKIITFQDWKSCFKGVK